MIHIFVVVKTKEIKDGVIKYNKFEFEDLGLARIFYNNNLKKKNVTVSLELKTIEI